VGGKDKNSQGKGRGTEGPLLERKKKRCLGKNVLTATERNTKNTNRRGRGRRGEKNQDIPDKEGEDQLQKGH